MTDDRAAERLIRKHLPKTSIEYIIFEHLSITRRATDDILVQPEISTNVGQQWPSETKVGYQVRFDIDRHDLQACAVVLIGYSVPDDEKLRTDQDVARIFASRVVIPAVFPYVRERVHQLSLDTGAAPLLLGILDPMSISLRTELST